MEIYVKMHSIGFMHTKMIDNKEMVPMKKLLAIVFSVIMMLTVVPMSVFAEEAADNTCGDNLIWSFDEELSELKVSGTGAMSNYSAASPAPWDEFRTDIQKITVEDGVTTIGNDTFTGCKGVTDVSLPDSLTKIGDSAFRDCTGLNEITIPDAVKSLGHYAFYGCKGLTELKLGDSVKTIGNYSFAKCTGIRIVTIPEAITTIGKNAFKDCSAIDFVIFKGTEEQWQAVTIGDGNEVLADAMIRFGEVKLGDANGDGQSNSTDALMCMQQSVGMVDFVGDWFDSMDVSGDGKVNSYDALKILKLSVGEIESL